MSSREILIFPTCFSSCKAVMTLPVRFCSKKAALCRIVWLIQMHCTTRPVLIYNCLSFPQPSIGYDILKAIVKGKCEKFDSAKSIKFLLAQPGHHSKDIQREPRNGDTVRKKHQRQGARRPSAADVFLLRNS